MLSFLLRGLGTKKTKPLPARRSLPRIRRVPTFAPLASELGLCRRPQAGFVQPRITVVDIPLDDPAVYL